MNHKSLLRCSAVAGWVLSLTLMVVATVAQALEVCAWSVLCAIVSCVPTFWLIVAYVIEHERDRTERLVEAVAGRFAIEEGMSRLPRRHST